METQTELDPGVGAVGQPALDQANVEFIGFSIRLAAWMVDFIILFIIQAALNAVGLYFVSLAVGPAYGVLFIGLRGQTPGKIALGIIVVDQHGNVPGIGRAIMREILGKLISGIFVLLGYLWIARDPQKRGWHDHLSGTFVVRKR